MESSIIIDWMGTTESMEEMDFHRSFINGQCGQDVRLDRPGCRC